MINFRWTTSCRSGSCNDDRSMKRGKIFSVELHNGVLHSSRLRDLSTFNDHDIVSLFARVTVSLSSNRGESEREEKVALVKGSEA